jgi:hypothetical protein
MNNTIKKDIESCRKKKSNRFKLLWYLRKKLDKGIKKNNEITWDKTESIVELKANKKIST